MKPKNDIRAAKLCYTHLGGKLGGIFLEYLIKEKWLVNDGTENYRLSDKGVAELSKAGIDITDDAKV